MVNKTLIRPYFWGGYVGGGRLTSHEICLNIDHVKGAKLMKLKFYNKSGHPNIFVDSTLTSTLSLRV